MKSEKASELDYIIKYSAIYTACGIIGEGIARVENSGLVQSVANSVVSLCSQKEDVGSMMFPVLMGCVMGAVFGSSKYFRDSGSRK
jgi:hypothetical protein